MPSDSPLDPENSALDGEILRALPEYEVDVALATTYSLDFETALVIPAKMAFQAAESRAQVLDTPLAPLDGLERLAERVAIFCEAGRIVAQPRAASRKCKIADNRLCLVQRDFDLGAVAVLMGKPSNQVQGKLHHNPLSVLARP